MILPGYLKKYCTVGSVQGSPPVPESLRGWNTYPGKGFVHYLPTNIALTDCPSGRIAYLHINRQIPRVSTLASARGAVIHDILHQAYLEVFGKPRMSTSEIIEHHAREKGVDPHTLARLAMYEKIRSAFRDFFKHLRQQGADVHSELEIDGAQLGLSSVRADLVLRPPATVIDLKTHKHRGSTLREHMLQVTAYALALESQWKEPVDLGAVLEIVEADDEVSLRVLPFYLSVQLRREVLRLISQKRGVCTVLDPPDPGLSDNCGSCRFSPLCYSLD